MIGKTIDQYKIVKALGKTAEVETMLAVHNQTGQKFVLKAVSTRLLTIPGFKERLLKDSALMIKLEHPNVVPLTNVLDDRGRLYTVREFVEGGILARKIEEMGGGNTLPGYGPIFKSMLKGMGYAHAEGLVHRFLCPENIVITQDGEVRIFGFEQVLAGEKEKRHGRSLITEARYFSPERFTNANTTDTRANIYALGAILFEVVTGMPPFDGKNRQELYQKHAKEPVPDPRDLQPGIAEEVVTIIFQAMAKQPEERFQTTLEMYKAVNRIADFGEGPSDPLKTQAIPVFEDEPGNGLDAAFGFGGRRGSFDVSDATSPDDSFTFDFGDESGVVPERSSGDPDQEAQASGNLDQFNFDISGDSLDKLADGEKGKLDLDLNGGTEQRDTNLDFDLGGGDTDGFEIGAENLDFGDSDGVSDLEAAFGSEAMAGMDELSAGAGEGTASPGETDGASFDFSIEEPSSDEGTDSGAFDFGLETGMSPAQENGEFSAPDLDVSPESGFGLTTPEEPPSEGFDISLDDSKVKDESGFDFFGSGDKDVAAPGGDFDLDSGPGNGDFNFDSPGAGDGFDFSLENNKDQGAADFHIGGDAELPTSQGDFGLDGKEGDDFDLGGPGEVDFDLEAGKDGNGFDLGGPGEVDFDLEAGKEGNGFDFGSDAGKEGNGFDFGDDFFSGQSASEPEFGIGGNDLASSPKKPDQFDFGDNLSDTAPEAEKDSGQPGKEENDFDFDTAPGDNQAEEFEMDGAQKSSGNTQGEGFSFDEEPEKDVFTFGGEDPFTGSQEGETFLDSADGEPVASAGTEDPFAELREQTTGPREPEPEPEEDSTEEQPFTPLKKETASLSTEDGAFSFESMPDMAAEVPPKSLENKTGMKESFAKLEKEKKETQKSVPVKVKRVKKLDKKILGITVGLAAILIMSGTWWFLSWKTRQQETQWQQGINQLVDQRLFEDALARITDHLAEGPTSKFERWLKEQRREIEKQKEDTENQVQSLFKRANTFEMDGRFLTDGKSDAIGTYMTIISLQPENSEALEKAKALKKEQLDMVAHFQENGEHLEALKILSALVNADRSDKEVRGRYQELKKRLKEEEAGTLQEKIGSLIAKQNYPPALPLLLELEQIDPKSTFVKQNREILVNIFVEQGQEFMTRNKFDNAENAYHSALELDPKNKKVTEALASVSEERLRFRISKTLDRLERAVNTKNLKGMYQNAIELNELDPGNQTANSARQEVIKQLDGMRSKAEKMKEMGQFKQAAAVYKSIYEIDGDEQTRALWDKYERWAPPPRMAFMPQGIFEMGYNRNPNTSPKHKVFISNVFVDQYEVTNRDFKAFVDANPKWHPLRIDSQYHDGNYLKHWLNGSPKEDDLDRPVYYVSWYAARAYAIHHNKRLPSEAEWEKAAAGNTTGQKFWWGNYSDAKMAVYEFYPEKKPAPVGRFPPNGFSIHEILGNVNEWVEDTYSETFYAQTKDARDPVNTETGTQKVFRGGSFMNMGRELTIFNRFHQNPRFCHASIGFRCAKDAVNFTP